MAELQQTSETVIYLQYLMMNLVRKLLLSPNFGGYCSMAKLLFLCTGFSFSVGPNILQ